MRNKLKFTLALLLAMAMVAAACGDSDEIDTSGLTTIDSGKLTVGSDIAFPPFEEFDAAGNVVGFDADIVAEIATRIGLTPEWVKTDFDTLFTQVAAARYDIGVAAITITAERAQQVNFTNLYYRSQQALVVDTAQTPDIGSVDDLGSGHSVAVQSGTTGEIWANDNLGPKGVDVVGFIEAPDTYIALEGGRVTGVVFDEPNAVEESGKRPDLEVVDTIDTMENYGIAVNPANQALLDAMNEALRQMIDDGTYGEIYDKWFTAQAGRVDE